MNIARQTALRFVLIIFALSVRAALADEIGGFEVLLHEFCGSGSANVFDGGDVVSSESCNFGGPPNTNGGGYSVFDLTQAGSLGAIALASGETRINPYMIGDTEGIRIRIDINAEYAPSTLPGGDNPGGSAESGFSSVMEFEMPFDELPWSYDLDIDEDFPFHGSTHIVMENITKGSLLLELSTEIPEFEGTLIGESGDLIRISSVLEGEGMMGPGSRREYEADFDMILLIPEPATVTLLMIGSVILVHSSTAIEGSRI